MGIVETKINNVMLGTIQNGSFVPIGKIDDIQSFEDNMETEKIDDNNTTIKLRDSYAYEFTCDISKRSRRRLEMLFIYGWQNKMPFRRRTLINAIIDRVNRDWRNFINEH